MYAWRHPMRVSSRATGTYTYVVFVPCVIRDLFYLSGSYYYTTSPMITKIIKLIKILINDEKTKQNEEKNDGLIN